MFDTSAKVKKVDCVGNTQTKNLAAGLEKDTKKKQRKNNKTKWLKQRWF